MVGRVPWIAILVVFLAACAAGGAPARAAPMGLTGHVQSLWTTVTLQDGSLGDRLFGRRNEQPVVGRFSSEGGPSFTLDQSGARPMLRFEGSTEIWVLRPSAGVRGDVYYRNDVGEVMLRLTRLGGLTLYTASNPGGLPCALEGGGRPLRMPQHDLATLLRHVAREAARGGSMVPRGRLEIVAGDFGDEAANLVGDATTVAVDGIVRLAQTDAGRERLANLRTMQIDIGASPGVSFSGTTLRIVITPRLGSAGRPSSARIIRALED